MKIQNPLPKPGALLAPVAVMLSTCLLLIACSSGHDDETVQEAPPYVVDRSQQTFVDTSRETPRSGDIPAQPTRVLESEVYIPQGTGPFPLLVFSHGLGGTPEFYAELLEPVAEAGFVVIAPAFPLTNRNAPGGPDAAGVQQQPGDVSFLVDSVIAAVEAGEAPFAGRVDVERVGTFGHSNGGITTLGITANSCCRDARIGAAVVLAGNPAPFADGEYDFTDTPPILLAHGTQDDFVAYFEAVRVFNVIHAAKGMLTLNGQDHGSYLVTSGAGFDSLLATTVDFFNSHLRGDTAAGARLESEEVPDTLAELRYAARNGADVTLPVPPPITNREATATPTTGLTDGQVVTVTWKNFSDLKINVLQCANGGTEGQSFCDFSNGAILLDDPTGEGTLDLEIIVGDVGAGRCDASTDDCVIVVNDGGLQDDPSATIRIPISFAP